MNDGQPGTFRRGLSTRFPTGLGATLHARTCRVRALPS
jgi:hypothetical protein